MTSDSALKTRRDAALGTGAPLFYEKPLHIVRGEGAYLFDAEGRRYIDMYNNVPCVGHANPVVVEAMHRQAQTLNVHSRYLHEGVVAYAERLAEKHAPSLNRVVFGCSGTEANEIAVAAARAFTGRQGIVCTDIGYHGNSYLIDKLTFAGERNDPEIAPTLFADGYRTPEPGMTADEAVDFYLADLRRAISKLESAGTPIACLIVCPIFANEGGTTIARAYLPKAAEIVREAGGVVISDEVQSGFCRTGRWWGYESIGFVPDIATMGKPMGNGMPISAAIANREIIEAFRKETDYFNTFASSPLQAAAGAAVLDEIERQSLQTQVGQVGDYLLTALRELSHPSIGEVRGDGLFLGVDWVEDRESKKPDAPGARRVVEAMKERGYLIGAAGAYDNVVKLRPPLVFDKGHADSFLTDFREALREYQP